MGKSYPNSQTKIFIDVPVDGAVLKLSDGMSNVRSVAVQPNEVFFFIYAFGCGFVDLLIALCLLFVGWQAMYQL